MAMVIFVTLATKFQTRDTNHDAIARRSTLRMDRKVNRELTEKELKLVREAVQRGSPFGSAD